MRNRLIAVLVLLVLSAAPAAAESDSAFRVTSLIEQLWHTLTEVLGFAATEKAEDLPLPPTPSGPSTPSTESGCGVDPDGRPLPCTPPPTP